MIWCIRVSLSQSSIRCTWGQSPYAIQDQKYVESITLCHSRRLCSGSQIRRIKHKGLSVTRDISSYLLCHDSNRKSKSLYSSLEYYIRNKKLKKNQKKYKPTRSSRGGKERKLLLTGIRDVSPELPPRTALAGFERLRGALQPA